jgi:HD-GYP domain-containing protein (c-di-GMP phosphodiesterase class II)
LLLEALAGLSLAAAVDSLSAADLSLGEIPCALVLVDGALVEQNPSAFESFCQQHPHAAVIVAGLHAGSETLWRALKSGARDCLTLPVSLSDLSATVTEALGRQFVLLRGVYEHSVQALVATIGLKDYETEAHCRRVAESTARIAAQVGLNALWQQEMIRWGAYLHDVGKIGIPDAILYKQAPLTPEEWEVMRRHPEIGRTVLDNIPFLAPALPVVLHHHERFDGSGYPDGLRGEEIPLEARIAAVTDAVDVMMTARPYRRALTWPAAAEELHRHRGTHFDPDLVDLALDLGPSLFGRLQTVPGATL